MPPKPRKSQGSSTSVFDKAIALFKKHIRNQSDKRNHRFARRLSDGLIEQFHNAQIEDAKGIGKTVVDIVHFRYPLFREDAQAIGDDFLAGVRSCILPYCDSIEPDQRAPVFALLVSQFETAIRQQSYHLHGVAASLGREEALHGMILPMDGTYREALGECFNLLDEMIEKHNLEVAARPAQTPAPAKTILGDHRPKHKIVKEGVKKMLESLRLEKPEATLDEAKRLYANQTNSSYASVNRAFHYDGKK